MNRLLLLALILVVPCQHVPAGAAESLEVAFSAADITPALNGSRPVYLAGYGQNRKAVGVHDKLYARAVLLRSGETKLALVSVDLIGLQYPAVQAIRARLKDYRYVLVASTHNHEGPDVIGMWGPSPVRSGVDSDYVELVVERAVRMVRDGEKRFVLATAEYGTADDASLLADSRLPKVYDPTLRALRFIGSDKKTVGTLVQWNCHPEAMGPKNDQLTADFPFATVAVLEQRFSAPVAYFSGAVGGLMTPPDGVVKTDSGQPLGEGDFEFCRRYGEAVGQLAIKALDRAVPVRLTPFAVSARPVAIPLANPLYQLGRAMGVLTRDGRAWTGDAERLGETIGARADANGKPLAIETEVAYLRLGELAIAGIPGELYPELVYGHFQTPADPAADFPQAALEPCVADILPEKKWLLFGLANDEVGYIIPKRQWDEARPFAYGRKESQYGEINSCGPEVAPILMQSLRNRVREAEASGQ